ncbi:MAG TPA: hypothetical protein VKC65_03910 [Gaiellaceae bacterium]|nr:hypothetical protein [Gaiellaceae bacterium]
MLILLAGVTVIVLEAPERTPKAQGPSGGPVRVEKALKPVRLTARDEDAALRVASQFVSSAVARKNVDRSWSLAAQELRSGLTRHEWDQGRLPVSPFSVGKTSWKFDYADSQGVGWTVTLYPARRSPGAAPQDFQIGLHPLGLGTHRRWVVDYWQASPTGAAALSATPSGGGPVAATPKAKESRVWLLLPLALLSLIVLIPIALVGVSSYRGYRARALMRR